jgi:hypothetical protein
VGVRLLVCLRFVVKDVDVSIADLQEIDVAGNNVAFEFEIEAAPPAVAEILSGEELRNFHRDGDRIIDQREPLQCIWR